jgi:hypothetical protein
VVSTRGSSDRNSRWTGVFLRAVLGEVTLGKVVALVPGLRWSKVSPDHILNESVLRSEGPLSTAVLLALSKPKESREELTRPAEKETDESESCWGGRDVSRT